ncbi:hypothetical protein TrVE_jg9799 [Triparma verrucosa]|uniref:Uncharacterized protein n=1 Tax=Triparma verrucosa TaxID=1606542 RepID=A0A9W7B259_9STRA|nr:hypothetical protein TrVE_jg9799 [Triparma verrucosa]
MVNFEGLEKYEDNVKTIGGRNILGSILFEKDDSRIILHTISGGQPLSPTSTSLTPLQTRWTLTAYFKPFSSRIIFTGISSYTLSPSPLKIIKQQDYWDSINLQPGGTYGAVNVVEGLKDFVDQVLFKGKVQRVGDDEIPYLIFRRAKDYTVRRYPETTWVKINYDRREEGYEGLGRIVKGYESKVLKPCRVDVDGDVKSMSWCIGFGEGGVDEGFIKCIEERGGEIVTESERTVAILNIPEATPNTVKSAERKLINSVEVDGLKCVTSSALVFAQYDEVFKMGKRRVEVWKDVESIWN